MRQIKATTYAGFQAHNECLLTCLALFLFDVLEINEIDDWTTIS